MAFIIKSFLKDFFWDGKYCYARIAILIILLGFSIRLFSFFYTYIINPDGVLYIHQARALYYGLTDSILTCSMGYLSNYSILIALAYTIFSDWEIAAKSVSIFFGTITLVPLYFLLARFFRKAITLIATLVFALIPVFVDKSVDVVRDPVYWFFSVLGLYLFVTQIEKKNYLYLILSSLSYLMATWARIEAILFVFVSLIYIPIASKDGKIARTSVFAIPVVLVLVLGMFGLMVLDISVSDFHRGFEITTKISAPVIEYKNLRQVLETFMQRPLDYNLLAFLPKARNLVWLVALGTLVRYAVKAYFHPFFLIFIVGFGGFWRRMKEDRRVLYLASLAFFALLLLYMHVLQTWMMFNRFLAIFIIPSFIFVGFGLEKIDHFLRSRFNLKPVAALSITCFLTLAFTLPANLEPRETDKLVFKRIGELIAEREGNSQVIPIVAPHSIRWISFYANVKYKGAPCPENNYDVDNIIGKSYGEFIQNLKRRGIRYVLWEEKHWPKQGLYSISNAKKEDLVKVGAWSHPDTGNLVLFEVI
jgi:hypothetical protein